MPVFQPFTANHPAATQIPTTLHQMHLQAQQSQSQQQLISSQYTPNIANLTPHQAAALANSGYAAAPAQFTMQYAPYPGATFPITCK